MIVAFDIDDTLWKVRTHQNCPPECFTATENALLETPYRKCEEHDRYDQIPDYDLISVLRWFYQNGDTIVVWSAGGQDHARTIVTKLGLDEIVRVIPKEPGIADITFDDQEVNLGKINIKVRRTPQDVFPEKR